VRDHVSFSNDFAFEIMIILKVLMVAALLTGRPVKRWPQKIIIAPVYTLGQRVSLRRLGFSPG
jgi:hypothetical protein